MTRSLQIKQLGFFSAVIAPAAVYVSLAAGSGNPVRCHENVCGYIPEYLLISMVLVFFATFTRQFVQLKGRLLVLAFLSLALLMYAQVSPMPAFVYGKVFGGLISSAFILVFAGHLLKTGGVDGFANSIARVMLIVLILTIVYKSRGDLLDRDVSYLLNGPIVFGWLMGFGALCAVNLMLEHQSWRWAIGALALTGGVFWSGSKGPILAYFLAVFFLFVSSGKYFRKLMLQSFLVGVILILAAYQLDLYSLLNETRFGLLLQIANDGVDITEGSVGVRASSYAEALELIGQNLPLGIGPGNFALYNPALMYPHNVHLEILLEYGLIPFLVYVAVIVYALARSGSLFRAIILFFLICMMFSGDASYLRFLLPFILLCTVANPQSQWRQPIARHHSVSIFQL